MTAVCNLDIDNNKPIRILHVIGIMNRGGAETMIMNLYRNIDRTRYQFDFVENSLEEAQFDWEIKSLGGKIYRCPHYNVKNHFEYVRWWKKFMKEHAGEYDIIHGHLGSTASIYLSIAKKYGLITIAHSHNTTRLTIKDIIYQLYAYPTRFIADNFLGCSIDAGISRYGKRISRSDRFFVLNNAINSTLFEYNEWIRHDIRHKYGIDDDIILIGHVGRFSEQKNHSFLIDIFDSIHNKNEKTKLLLIGDGYLKDNIIKKIKEKNLQQFVILTGVQSDVAAFYQAMDVFVFPSLYEGLGIVIVEAQASGLPCVITETIPNECIVTKKLVSKVSLSDSSDVWARIILNNLGQERVSRREEVIKANYDISSTSKWLERYYSSLIKGKRK